MKYVFVLTLLTLWSSLSFAKDTPVIVFGVNMDYAMPLVQIKNESGNSELTRGILKDLGEALAKELKVTPKWFLLPKRRVAPALSSGRVDILCHLNEVWQPKIKDDVWWSNKLYRSSNVLVFSKDHQVTSIKEIYNEPVGVVLNFIYTGLDPLFKTGTLKREDGDVVQTKCAVSKKSPLKIEDVNRAIATIHRNGVLSKILRSYYYKQPQIGSYYTFYALYLTGNTLYVYSPEG